MSTPKYIDSFVVLSKTELSKLSQKDRMEYKDSLKYYRDLHNSLNYTREEGFEKGEEKVIIKGIEQGEKQKAVEIAKNLLSIRLSIEEISTITGLSVKEIQQIINSL